jgi:hypothetical protein
VILKWIKPDKSGFEWRHGFLVSENSRGVLFPLPRLRGEDWGGGKFSLRANINTKALRKGLAFSFVIAGLDPAIHLRRSMDTRVKPAHDCSRCKKNGSDAGVFV